MEEPTTDITLHDVVQASNVTKVFEIMLSNGGNQKQACAQVGISEKTFVRAVRDNPVYLKQLHGFVLGKLAGLTDAIGDMHSDAVETLRKEIYRLKALLDIDIIDPNDMPISFEDRLKIANGIMKIDKYLMATITAMLPTVKEKAIAPEDTKQLSDKEKEEMHAIFSSLKGAERIKVTRSEQVIEFSNLPQDQRPSTDWIEPDTDDEPK